MAFTDRHGGVSQAPYDTLNFGVSTGDTREAVEQNCARLADALGLAADRIAWMNQMHGADVAVIDHPQPPRNRPAVDAVVTRQRNLALAVRMADCVPVLLWSPNPPVIACVHAGRPSLAAGVLPNTVAQVRELGARQITSWIGPHVCGACYEVSPEIQDQVVAALPSTKSTTSWGTPSLDLGKGAVTQLIELGCEVVDTQPACTRESADLFSHRRDGPATGRLAGLIWMRP